MQTISRSATMIARKRADVLWFEGVAHRGMALDLHLLLGGGVSPVQEPRMDTAGRSSLWSIPRTGTFRW